MQIQGHYTRLFWVVCGKTTKGTVLTKTWYLTNLCWAFWGISSFITHGLEKSAKNAATYHSLNLSTIFRYIFCCLIMCSSMRSRAACAINWLRWRWSSLRVSLPGGLNSIWKWWIRNSNIFYLLTFENQILEQNSFCGLQFAVPQIVGCPCARQWRSSSFQPYQSSSHENSHMIPQGNMSNITQGGTSTTRSALSKCPMWARTFGANLVGAVPVYVLLG